MKEESKCLLIFIFVSIIAIFSFFAMASKDRLTGAYSVICLPKYSEASGKYYTSCAKEKWIRNPEFERGIRVDRFEPGIAQQLNQFPLEGIQRRYYPDEKIVHYYGTPRLTTYKDSSMGTFEKI